jgi:uncharacterized protein (TIGR02246 family)
MPNRASSRTCHVLAVLVPLAVGCAAPRVSSDPAADSVAIRALIDRTEAANNRGDVAAWVALFEDHAVYMPPGSPPITTRTGLREVASAGFSQFEAAIEIIPSELVVLGDWAFARSHVTGTAMPKAGGEAVPIDVKQLVLYHRQSDASWRIARLINNSNRE